MQVFINLITRAFFMSTPLILGALGEVLAERTGMMVTAVEGIFLIGAWGGFIGAYLSGSMLAGFLLAMICGLLVAALYGVTTVYMHIPLPAPQSPVAGLQSARSPTLIRNGP